MKSTKNAGLITVLILRLIVLVFLLVSIAVLTTDTLTSFHSNGATGNKIKLGFRDTYAYRYVLSTAVMGCAYTLLQIPFEIFNVIKAKNLGRDHSAQILIVTDLVLSLLFAAGVGAGFGETVELRTWLDGSNDPDKRDLDKFYDMVHVATGFLLMATGVTAFITLISIFGFAKK